MKLPIVAEPLLLIICFYSGYEYIICENVKVQRFMRYNLGQLVTDFKRLERQTAEP